MKISTNWLKDYINLDNINLKDLANKITNTGVNVEAVSSGIDSSHLVVGEVLECVTHPNSDHLHICKVDVGKENLQIVCGAKNVRENLKVIVSLIGAVLPENFEIKKSVIRGIESFGMLCALSELGLESDSEGIHELPSNAVVGSNPLSYLNINDDTIYTLDLNPNRNDCLSHLGFAYEAAASLNTKVKTPDTKYKEIEENINDSHELIVNTENCTLMLLKLVKNISIKESPKFIQDRLTSVGMRPINNAVDISNYIMLEYGQPLHFYDADKLGKVLEVRMAKKDEIIETLDKNSRVMNEKDIIISNGKSAIGIAGVMGGYSTEVDENTKNIIIESAIFNPLLVRNTSIRLDLRSEASLRFEKGLNYDYTYEAIDRACNLLETHAKGNVCKGMLEHSNIDKTPKKASVTLEKINSCLGIKLTEEEVNDSFNRLGFEYTGHYNVIIPNRRMDVLISEDLIEEVGRMYGFEKIKGSMPTQELKMGSLSPKIKYRKDISKRLRSLGLNEVKTYSLVNEKNADTFNYKNESIIKLDRPISKDRTHIRTSLISSLLEVNSYNISRGLEDINIYEIANIYHSEDEKYIENTKLCILLSGSIINNSWNKTIVKNDFYTIKGIVENIIHYLGFSKRLKFTNDNIYSFMHPGISANIIIDKENVGFFGRLNPSVSKKDIYICEINIDSLFNKKHGKLKFTEPNKYPCVKRDVAFIVENKVSSEQITNEILKVSKLITECTPFDEYKMGDKKSLAFSLKFENYEHTMSENEINELFIKLIDEVCKKYNAILRDK